jgi:hypothetical protein
MSAVEEWDKAIQLAKEAGVDGWAVMNHDLCSAAIAELEARIEKLNAGHAAQVSAIVQTREHAEAELEEWKQKAFDFGENRDNVQAAYDEKASLLREAEAELSALRWQYEYMALMDYRIAQAAAQAFVLKG